jgi:hypothetical protein
MKYLTAITLAALVFAIKPATSTTPSVIITPSKQVYKNTCYFKQTSTTRYCRVPKLTITTTSA